MHLSATAITALLLVAGVGGIAEAAPSSAGGRSIIAVSQTVQAGQVKPGDGSVRTCDGSVKPGDGSVTPAPAQSGH